MVGRREGIHQSVAHEVAHIFRGKTAEQLDQLKIQIEKKINSKAEGVDIGYWETLLSQLKGSYLCIHYTTVFYLKLFNFIAYFFTLQLILAHVARARLRDRHQENLKKKLEVLKAQQRMTESQFYSEEGTSSNRHIDQEMAMVSLPSGRNEPTTSKESPTEKEDSQSSAEDMR